LSLNLHFEIKSISGAKDSYKVDETICLSIKAVNGDGTSADSLKGFFDM
jgi:hypothetical protein